MIVFVAFGVTTFDRLALLFFHLPLILFNFIVDAFSWSDGRQSLSEALSEPEPVG